MIVPKFKPVSRQNVPQAPEWVEKITDPIVDQIKDLTRAAQNQLSFYDNMNAEVREFSVSQDEWTTIQLNVLRGSPIGVYLLWTELDDYCKFKWKRIDIKRVSIKVYFDSAPATETKIRIVVMGR